LALALAAAACGQDTTAYRTAKALVDLNDTPALNRKGRRDLVEMGSAVVPRLVQEVQKGSQGAAGDVLFAARCLRVLREMKHDSGLKTACELLRTLAPRRDAVGDPVRVLLSEAMYYVADNVSNENARVALYDFVANGRDRWRGRSLRFVESLYKTPPKIGPDKVSFAELERWPAEWADESDALRGLRCDVYYGLARLVEAKDGAIAPALIRMLDTEPYRYVVCPECLDADGFTPVSLSSGPWPDPQGRARVLIMRWIGDLKYAPAVPRIEKALTSSYGDEREAALRLLDRLAGKADAGKTDGQQTVTDTITLRDGQVIRGDVENKELTIKTSYASLTLPVAQIGRVQFGGPAEGADRIDLHTGDRLVGTETTAEIRAQSRDGKKVVLPKAQVAGIVFDE